MSLQGPHDAVPSAEFQGRKHAATPRLAAAAVLGQAYETVKSADMAMTTKQKRYGIMAGLALLGLAACSGQENDVRDVSLAVLVNQAEQLDGSSVATQGVVRHFGDPLHYWIEDEDLNRVEIFPHELIEPHLGETVRVVGDFEYSPTEGRRLTLASVEPVVRP